jgi:uncharacterized protein YndB with AHSA1/START domain
MKSFSATTTINASPETIWEILTNANGYPDWDPGIDRIEGHIAMGEKVKFFTKFNPSRAFAQRVTTFEPGRKMVFIGGLPFGLFKSERTYDLTANADGTTTYVTREVFSRSQLPLFGRKIPDLTERFEKAAAGLKELAEKGGST